MATVPSELSWAVGQRVTAALLNTNLHDAVNYLISVPRVQVYQDTTGTSVPDSAFTSVTFNKESFDSDSMHSTASLTSRLVCVTAGTYTLKGGVAFVGNATGVRTVRWALNGTLVGPSMRLLTCTATAATIPAPEWDIALVATDYVELQAFQTSGGALLTSVTATDFSYASARWIST